MKNKIIYKKNQIVLWEDLEQLQLISGRKFRKNVENGDYTNKLEKIFSYTEYAY